MVSDQSTSVPESGKPQEEGWEPYVPDLRYVPVEYSDALLDFLRLAKDALLTENTLIGPTRGRKTVHGGVFRNVPGITPLDHPLFAIQAPFQIHIGELSEGNVDSFIDAFYQFAKIFQEEQECQLLRIVEEVARAVGNETQSRCSEFTADDLINMEESMDVEYDDAGRPVGLVIVCNPETHEKLKQIQWTPEQIERQRKMRESKQEAQRAAKRTRRLHKSSLRTRT